MDKVVPERAVSPWLPTAEAADFSNHPRLKFSMAAVAATLISLSERDRQEEARGYCRSRSGRHPRAKCRH